MYEGANLLSSPTLDIASEVLFEVVQGGHNLHISDDKHVEQTSCN